MGNVLSSHKRSRNVQEPSTVVVLTESSQEFVSVVVFLNAVIILM